ncbi:MAG: hypothetical protein QOE73_755 [Verrucomicrobiota bacterium]
MNRVQPPPTKTGALGTPPSSLLTTSLRVFALRHSARRTILSLILATASGLNACAQKTVRPQSLRHASVCKPRVVGIGSKGSGLSTLSATTQAIYALTTVDSTVRGYIVAARGRPFWFEGSIYGSGGIRVNALGQREDTWRAGRYRYTVVYDSVANTAALAGARVGLDTGMVLLLDRVDSVGGPPHVVGVLCPPEIRWESPARSLLDLLPALRAYAGDDAGA